MQTRRPPSHRRRSHRRRRRRARPPADAAGAGANKNRRPSVTRIGAVWTRARAQRSCAKTDARASARARTRAYARTRAHALTHTARAGWSFLLRARVLVVTDWPVASSAGAAARTERTGQVSIKTILKCEIIFEWLFSFKSRSQFFFWRIWRKCLQGGNRRIWYSNPQCRADVRIRTEATKF